MSAGGLGPYSCRHGICRRVPSCEGGICQARAERHERAAKDSVLGFSCEIGACAFSSKCETKGSCIWSDAGRLNEDATDTVLRHVGYIKDVPTQWQFWNNAQATSLSWSEVGDPLNFNTKQEETTMDDPNKRPGFSFMWGNFPDEAGPVILREATPEEIETQRQGWAQSCVGKEDDRQARPFRVESMGDAEAGVGYVRSVQEAPSDLRQPIPLLPQNSGERKETPICTGVFDYFPRALAYVARVSRVGNDKHNPGEPLHWSKHKSTDHADCIGRHLIERGEFDEHGLRHSGMLAWRALALLEMELEADAMGCTVEELIDGYKAEAE